jgi:peptidylprolyl isomerase
VVSTHHNQRPNLTKHAASPVTKDLTTPHRRDIEFPPFGRQHLDNSLKHLAELAERTWVVPHALFAGLPADTAQCGCSVTTVNSSRVYSSVALAACAAAIVMTSAACGSDTDTSAASSSAPSSVAGLVPAATTETAVAAAVCPTAAPTNAGAPEWTLTGATGSIAVTGSTDSVEPLVDVTPPFSVTETQVHTLKAGDGPVVADTATVSVCYMGVNGRDGTVFDSSYKMGSPVEFPLDGVVPGFQKAIAGQTVGSTVAVAMVPADGYPEGQPAAGIQKGDTLIFAIKILDVSS